MSRRKRKGSKAGHFSAGDPPLPAPHSSAPGPAPASQAQPGSPAQPGSQGAVGGAPPPGGITRNGWIIIGVVIVVVGAAVYLFSRGDSSLGLGSSNGDPSDPANPRVVIETSVGTIKAELYQNRAPITVENFLKYMDAKHYDGTIFHRVIRDFMIQGGGMGPDKKERKGRAPIKNESNNGLTNVRGTLAMARTDQPNSATAQFFINVVDNDFLNRAKAEDRYGYAVFGKVTEGMDVADRIRAVATNGKNGGYVPLEPVFIKSIRRAEAK